MMTQLSAPTPNGQFHLEALLQLVSDFAFLANPGPLPALSNV
jgi:hypothetical protein